MNIRQLIRILPLLAKYNLKVIFAGKFIWFLVSALAFLLLIMFMAAWENQVEMSEGSLYSMISYPAILIIFYPTVFGIQNDEDARILELLFGIPDYKYKVWLTRLVMIYVSTFVILILFACIAHFLLYPVKPVAMAAQLMFPLVFYGNLSFMLSTLIRNGNGTAAVMLILLIFIRISSEGFINASIWNAFLNPFSLPRGMIPEIWEGIIVRNRIILLAVSLICMMAGLLNLSRREKFL
jgi:hypothetical protein